MWRYASNPLMARYTPVPWSEDNIKSKQDVESYIENFCIPHRWCRSLCIEDRSIGMLIITPAGSSSSSWRKGNLGGLVSPEYWSKGVGTRAAEIAVVDGFRVIPEMVRMECSADVENVGMHKILEKAGFRREGVLRKFLFHRGEDRDVVMFSMLVDDQKRLALVGMSDIISSNISSRL
ncbi:Uncharacterized N-acetyltransferase YoaA [Linum grandiflorum]